MGGGGGGGPLPIPQKRQMKEISHLLSLWCHHVSYWRSHLGSHQVLVLIGKDSDYNRSEGQKERETLIFLSHYSYYTREFALQISHFGEISFSSLPFRSLWVRDLLPEPKSFTLSSSLTFLRLPGLGLVPLLHLLLPSPLMALTLQFFTDLSDFTH